MNNKCIEKGCFYCKKSSTEYRCGRNLTAPSLDPDTCKDYKLAQNMDYTKPPLGASPAYITAEGRIKELADAISRASVEGRNYTGHISLWAKEILMQCRIMQYVKEDDDT